MRCDNRSKALLINPPIYDFALYDLYHKPYGLLRIGTWLRNCGWEVEFLNCLDYTCPETSAVLGKPKRFDDGTGKFHRKTVSPPPVLQGIERNYARYGITSDVMRRRIHAAFVERGVDAVFITTGMTYWYPGIVETARIVRDVVSSLGSSSGASVPVIAGGIYASLLPKHAKEIAGADYVVQGDAWDETASGSGNDGRVKLSGLLQRLGFPCEASAGAGPTAYPAQGGSGLYTQGGMYPEAAVFVLNRGCPFSCTYCACSLLCPQFVPGDPEAAFSYFQHLYDEGVRNFAFYDDALLYRKEDVLLPFLRAVIDGGYAPRFYTPNAVHLRYIDPETASLMERAGFTEVRLGFESADEGFHALYDSKIDVRQFAERVAMLEAAGFSPERLRVYVLAGLPGQQAEEAEASIRYAHEAGVRVMLARYSPVPGTALWEESIRKSRYPLAEEPLFHNNTFFPMEWDSFTRTDLQRLQDLTVDLNRVLCAKQ